MSNQQRLKECDRLKIIVEFIKTGKAPEGFNVKEDGNGGFRVSTIKVKDPAIENSKKRAKLIKKLIDIDPSLSERFNEKENDELRSVAFPKGSESIAPESGAEPATESGAVEEVLASTEE